MRGFDGGTLEWNSDQHVSLGTYQPAFSGRVGAIVSLARWLLRQPQAGSTGWNERTALVGYGIRIGGHGDCDVTAEFGLADL